MPDPETLTQELDDLESEDSPLPHVRNIKDPIYDYSALRELY
jgi:hypothetical protein